MRKGISLSIVGGVILALVGVFVMLTAFTGSFGNNFEQTFCKVYRSVAMVFPGGDTPPPSGCETGSGVDYVGVEETDKEELVLNLASAVSNCWQQYNGYLTDKEVCEGWNLVNFEGKITENDVKDVLNENNLCEEIGGCDNLRMDSVEGESFVVIQYRYKNEEEFIEVK